MATKKLDMKPVEFGLASEPMKCEVCGGSIQVGRPFMRKNQITIVGGEFVQAITTECLHACSAYQKAGQSEEVLYRPQRAHVFDPCWEGRDVGDETTRIYTKNGLTLVATGYTRIVSRGAYRLVEVTEKQIQKSQFVRHKQEDDPAGIYESWITGGSGMKIRHYLEADRDSLARHWYLPLERVVTEAGLKFGY